MWYAFFNPKLNTHITQFKLVKCRKLYVRMLFAIYCYLSFDSVRFAIRTRAHFYVFFNPLKLSFSWQYICTCALCIQVICTRVSFVIFFFIVKYMRLKFFFQWNKKDRTILSCRKRFKGLIWVNFLKDPTAPQLGMEALTSQFSNIKTKWFAFCSVIWTTHVTGTIRAPSSFSSNALFAKICLTEVLDSHVHSSLTCTEKR